LRQKFLKNLHQDTISLSCLGQITTSYEGKSIMAENVLIKPFTNCRFFSGLLSNALFTLNRTNDQR